MRKFLFCTIFFLCPVYAALAQASLFPAFAVCQSACAGNLGENIFPDGDFGAGTDNILQTNPGIAPGYSYQFNPPPNDGFYVITNNTTNWGSFAGPAWINIMDRGPEPNGYMMVVNAAFSPGIFYEKTVSVCENTLYEMSVDVISLIENELASTHIRPNIAFYIDGVEVCNTGEVPNDENWYNFRFSFTTTVGTNSVNLSFRNNSPGGMGNDLAIDNISFKACGPKINLQDTVYYCIGQELEIKADFDNSPYNSPVYQWQISTDMGLNWQNISGATDDIVVIPQPSTTQLYRMITANSINNLSQPSCRVLSFNVRPVLDDLSAFAIAGQDTIVCNGAPAILEAGLQNAYLWSDGSIQPTLTAPDPGWYAVTITSPRNCPATDSLYVFLVNLSVDINSEDPVCFGDSTGYIAMSNRQGGIGPLRYRVVPADWQADPVIQDLPDGQYMLQIIDSIGCLVEKTIDIINPPQYKVDLGPDKTITACETITIPSQWNYEPIRYEWTGDLSCTTCTVPMAMPLRDTLYTLTVTDLLGCTATDSLSVKVLPLLDLYVPNVFKPDTGNNDFFTLFTSKSAVLIHQFAVYDRWGSLVFEAKNQLPGSTDLRWDGLCRDKQSASGVYIWIAEIEYNTGFVKRYEGDVLLVR